MKTNEQMKEGPLRRLPSVPSSPQPRSTCSLSHRRPPWPLQSQTRPQLRLPEKTFSCTSPIFSAQAQFDLNFALNKMR